MDGVERERSEKVAALNAWLSERPERWGRVAEERFLSDARAVGYDSLAHLRAVRKLREMRT